MTPKERYQEQIKELKDDVESERYTNLRIPERKIGALFVLNMLLNELSKPSPSEFAALANTPTSWTCG